MRIEAVLTTWNKRCFEIREQSHREGGRGVQWPRDPWTLGGPWGGPWASVRPLASAGPTKGPWAREGPIKMTLRNQHVRSEDLFFFGDHLISTKKTVRISVKNFFFVFWRPHHNSEKTAAFSPSVLEFTKPEIRHIWAGPGPTFGSRRPWSGGLGKH